MNVLAVGLAALGAVLFGLASVRQHRAVRDTAAPARPGVRAQLAAGLRLLRQPSWLLGAGQAVLGGGLHVVALALAPITLVQPVGVLAVPVTVVASAIARRRRPSRSQTLGSLLSVVGVAALTVVLLLPASRPASLPTWPALAVGVGSVAAGAGVLALVLGRAWAPPLVRCVGRAVAAAVLFGLNSVLVRTLGQVVATSSWGAHVGVVVVAVAGLAVALPLGVWSMQSAYLSGSPQVVICCLTLVDPLTAVVGGRTFLQDGAAVTGGVLAAAVACALVAALGVVLLARDYPAEHAPQDGPGAGPGVRRPASLRA